MTKAPTLPFSARMAADDLHRSLDLAASTATVMAQFAGALQAAYDRGREDQREGRDPLYPKSST